MKLDSKYFDSIRIGGRRAQPPRANEAMCQWHGCQNAGRHRAPRGRGREGQFFVFCLDHVRQYNAAYNYFDGMSDSQVNDFQKDAVTGHRPTWTMGSAGGAAGSDQPQFRSRSRKYSSFSSADMNDPHEFFTETSEKKQESGRRVRNVERRSLEALNLPPTASKNDIKARFKELVKRHHPDVNGGDTRSEDKLREIIQAYNYLKQAGLV